MKKNKRPQLLLPCYEHWYREWAQFYKEYNWVQYEGSKQWYFVESIMTPVYKLTPEEEKEFKEENRKAELLNKLENEEEINQKELSQDEKYMVWKMKFQKGGNR
jgi:pyruvate/2-oxoacid:ferredoxin oxidoreductase beta subunit|tara:strand:- start:864 stop:1175 length:312 start_codon:yes stop_codon:yes gene_type:complete